jgi:hypothetical protein
MLNVSCAIEECFLLICVTRSAGIETVTKLQRLLRELVVFMVDSVYARNRANIACR